MSFLKCPVCNKSSIIDVIIITTSLGRDNILLEIERYNIRFNCIYIIGKSGLEICKNA